MDFTRKLGKRRRPPVGKLGNWFPRPSGESSPLWTPGPSLLALERCLHTLLPLLLFCRPYQPAKYLHHIPPSHFLSARLLRPPRNTWETKDRAQFPSCRFSSPSSQVTKQWACWHQGWAEVQGPKLHTMLCMLTPKTGYILGSSWHSPSFLPNINTVIWQYYCQSYSCLIFRNTHYSLK